MTTTSALVVTRHGGPEVLAVEEREVAPPGPGEALVEVAAIVLTGWAVVAGMRQWGPARVSGMATRAEAETLLGVARLRRVAPVIRPDLNDKRGRR